jgi:septal ring factor EnvC (AmiA/AmiB activator)
MVCSIVKKGLLGAALGAGALYLVFGTSAPSYVSTAFHKVRQNAKDSVGIQFEIDRTRGEIAHLEPAIKDNIEILARAEVDVEHLEREIAAMQDNLAVEKRKLLAQRERLEKGEFRLTGRGTADTEAEARGDLARRFDHYRNTGQILKEKEATLKAKQRAVLGARQQLTNMAAQKKALETKLDGIEARLKMIEATKATNEFNFDDSSLARAKQSVAELEKRLDVMARVAEQEGKFAEGGMPVVVDPGRDVLKEIDAEFGGPARHESELKGTGKSL